jgi:membrane protease YdiL (CAAX protease family)
VSVAAPSSKRQNILEIALFMLLTFGLSWTLVPFFGRAWVLGTSLPNRLFGVALPYVIMMGWQPFLAVVLIRAWAEPEKKLEAGLRPAAQRYLALAIVSALSIAAMASLVNRLARTAIQPWFAPLASALPNAPSSFDSMISMACMGVTLVLVWAQARSEEIGFRGYLLERTVHLCGPLPGLVVHAFLWGIWYAPVILLSRDAALGATLASGWFIVSSILLGALLGCLRLVGAIIAPSTAATVFLTLGAGLPFLVNGLDVGLRTRIYEPCGWIPMLLVLVGMRCGGVALAMGERGFRREEAYRHRPPVAEVASPANSPNLSPVATGGGWLHHFFDLARRNASANLSRR